MYRFDYGELMRLSSDSNIKVLAIARYERKRRLMKQMARLGHPRFNEILYDEAFDQQVDTRGSKGPGPANTEPTDITAYRASYHCANRAPDLHEPNTDNAMGVIVPLVTGQVVDSVLSLHTILSQQHPETTPPSTAA